MKNGGVYLGFHTFRVRKFSYGNCRTPVFCKVKTQIVGKTKFFDSLSTVLYVRCFFHLQEKFCARTCGFTAKIYVKLPKNEEKSK